MRSFNEFVRGMHFTVKTGRRPLVNVFSKITLDVLPPPVQRADALQVHHAVRLGKSTSNSRCSSRLAKVSPLIDTVALFTTEAVNNAISTLLLHLNNIKSTQSTEW